MQIVFVNNWILTKVLYGMYGYNTIVSKGKTVNVDD